MMTVAAIGRVYVKATRFLAASAVEVELDGIRQDRAFALVEAGQTAARAPDCPVTVMRRSMRARHGYR